MARELVRSARSRGAALTGPGGLLKALTKTVIETALDEEMADHLGYDKHDPTGRNSGNSRNGVRTKTVLTDNCGPVEIEVPRDRNGSFDPAIVKKWQRRSGDVDTIVLSLFSKGLTTGDVPGLGWHAWDGARWAADTGDRHAKQAVIRAVRQARLDAARMRSNKDRDELWSDAKSCETATGVRGVLEIAAALPPLSALAPELDQGVYLLNTPRETLDLRTGAAHPSDPKDRLTKSTGCVYDPDASSETWEEFLAVTLPDEEVRRFLQRVVGCSLVGRVIEHVLPILTGSGRNGKGTFVRTVANALGDYAIETEPDLFMARERAHPTGLLDLRGVRFATCQETDAGRRLDVAVVKRLTGGDTIRARRMRQDYIEFTPSHQPFLITNHLPKVPADDPALWARLLVVPFDQSFLGREDRGLEERLSKDLAAVLAWAVAGWAEYQRLGSLEPPESVTAATSSYRVNNDHLAQFFEDQCLLNPHMHVMSSALWGEWEAWCTASNIRPGTNRTFKADLEAHGIVHERGMHGVRYRGIGLKRAE